ncbi:hypothetical protein BK004_04905 [bacterium CG10_46_32]|nr:MAG: hypothetical protein BK004_04905 [bacterium CG10_46_32]PIR55654.1 MAG: hypothetical protein COU73_04955 [Parcubacteria group bacterium CG10_big_fil_rev_8_21_14_0_10_46_32]
MKKILLTLALLVLPIAAQAYVSPGSPAGFVNDFAGVLSQQQEQVLESTLSQYQAQTGNEIAVVLVNSVGDETIETYAVRLFEEWGIGKKGEDNGALFVAAMSDRVMKIETGYGLEGELTDIEASRIVDTVVPDYFRAEDYDGGIAAAVSGIIQAIGQDFDGGGIVVTPPPKQSAGIGEYFWLIIFVFIWVASVLARSRSWWAGGVVGAVGGVIIGFAAGAWWWLPILVVAGMLLDYLVSTKYRSMFIHKDGTAKHHSMLPWIFLMGGRPGRWDKGGGGFGGFGGGMSGGGGAAGRW